MKNLIHFEKLRMFFLGHRDPFNHVSRRANEYYYDLESSSQNGESVEKKIESCKV